MNESVGIRIGVGILILVAIIVYVVIVKLAIDFLIKPYKKKENVRDIKLYIACLSPITVVYFLYIAGLFYILFKFV